VLGKCLYNRFITTPSDDDYKEGVAILDNIILFRGRGDTSSSQQERALRLAGMFARAQISRSGKPEDLEEAIFRTRSRLDGTLIQLEDTSRPLTIEKFSFLERLRLHKYKVTDSELAAWSRNPEYSRFPSFRDLTASLTELNSHGQASFGGDTREVPRASSNTCHPTPYRHNGYRRRYQVLSRGACVSPW
jgi:hypothetical protein